MRRQPLDERACGLLLARESHLERLEPAADEPGGVGRGDDAREPPGEVESVAQLLVTRDSDTGDDVVVPGEHLRRRVERDLAAVLQRAQPERRGDGRVADHGCRVRNGGLEVGHRQQRVGGSLDEDQVDLVRWCARLVELDDVHAPAAEMVEEHPVPVVRPLRQRDGAAGAQQRQHDGRDRPHPGRIEQRVAAVERSERLLAGHAGRMVGARVREPPRLALLVRPRGGAIERRAHGGRRYQPPLRA